MSNRKIKRGDYVTLINEMRDENGRVVHVGDTEVEIEPQHGQYRLYQRIDNLKFDIVKNCWIGGNHPRAHDVLERQKTLILKPDEAWLTEIKGEWTSDSGTRIKDQVIDQMNNEPKCTCGVDKVGYGIHSDWCDKALK